MTDVRTSPAPTTTDEPQGQGDFVWYELMTTDPAGAKTFYDAVIGWNIDAESAMPTGYRMIGRSDGGFAGGLFPLDDQMLQNGAKPTWMGYVSVADVDKAITSIEQAGGHELMPAFDVPEAGRIAMVADPQGIPLYVMTPTPPKDDPDAQSDVFSASAEQRVGWNELNTTDLVNARRFYENQFGWDGSDFMDMGELGEYRFLNHGDTRLGALCGISPGGAPHWRFYFRVPSINAAKQMVEAKGGTVCMGPHQVPTGDWIIIGNDPQGAEFALVGGQ